MLPLVTQVLLCRSFPDCNGGWLQPRSLAELAYPYSAGFTAGASFPWWDSALHIDGLVGGGEGAEI